MRSIRRVYLLSAAPAGSLQRICAALGACGGRLTAWGQVTGDAVAFERKLASISRFRSQAQFEQLVANVRRSGPIEHLRELRYRLYSPDSYRERFASTPLVAPMAVQAQRRALAAT